jgi:hypothetical protein
LEGSGELKISAPIGYAWDRHVGLGFDPDRRLQEVIRLVFHIDALCLWLEARCHRCCARPAA